jgi:hypothetical protein
VTSDQRRNVMACRKLAQQRVLRIMQEQSSKHSDDLPILRPAERDANRRLGANKPGKDREKRETL